jgi:hypothetical protein
VLLDAQGRPTRAPCNSDSFRGSQWNLNVRWSFADPRVMSEQISSRVDDDRHGGMTARGPAGGYYSFVMIRDQAIPLVAAAFTIVTRGLGAGHGYIQSVSLNLRPLTGRFWITHRELTPGGTLEITLGPRPDRRWGIAAGRGPRPRL